MSEFVEIPHPVDDASLEEYDGADQIKNYHTASVGQYPRKLVSGSVNSIEWVSGVSGLSAYEGYTSGTASNRTEDETYSLGWVTLLSSSDVLAAGYTITAVTAGRYWIAVHANASMNACRATESAKFNGNVLNFLINGVSYRTASTQDVSPYMSGVMPLYVTVGYNLSIGVAASLAVNDVLTATLRFWETGAGNAYTHTFSANISIVRIT